MTTWTLQSKYGGQTEVVFNSTYTFNELLLMFNGLFTTGYSNQSKNNTSFSNQSKSSTTTYTNQIKN